MCGIVGFAGFDQPELLDRMASVLVHRGPDDYGAYRSTEQGGRGDVLPVSMAVRRLAIMDPASGAQPMLSDEAAIAFNGEIYNHRELAIALREKGVSLQTQCDTEVILKGYSVWGWRGLLSRLNGMFAIALHDRQAGTLYVARDRTGQKPLYYATCEDGAFLFASEIKALLQSRRVPVQLNFPAVDQFLTLRYVPQPNTLLRAVRVLPAGHELCWNAAGPITIQSYWTPPIEEISSQSDADLLDEFTHLLDAAVRRTTRSDVPVGTYLSGGVDSSLLAATLVRQCGDGSTFSGDAFSLGFDSSVDETRQAGQLAERLGLKHHVSILSELDAGDLSRALWHLDRPIGEPLVLGYFALARLAREHVKVVFSGEGADELFAGYSFHRVLRWVEQYERMVPSMLRRRCVLPLLRCLPIGILNQWFSFPAYLGSAGKQRFVGFLENYSARDLGQNYVALRTLYDPGQRRGLYAREFRAQATEDWIHGVSDGTARPLERLLNLQYHDWLQDFALLRQDKMSMAHGLEVRLPMLDNTLIDFAAKLPARLKVRGSQNKVLLRRLASLRLPGASAWRKKQAFYLPLERFYRQPSFQQLLDQTLDPAVLATRGIFDGRAIQGLRRQAESGEFLVLKQLMALVMLELWMKMFIDGERPF